MNIALLASLAFQLSWAEQSQMDWPTGTLPWHVIMVRPRQTRVMTGDRLFCCDSVDTYSKIKGGP